MRKKLAFTITAQPDETTCGPACLHAVYRYYGDDMPVEQVVAEVPALDGGGTLGVHLACHALRRGYRATLYTYNLMMFDPTWFQTLAPGEWAAKLREQARHKADGRLQFATPAYLEFMERGGVLRFQDLTNGLIRKYLNQEAPLITGLSSTFLYRCVRERATGTPVDDDVRGEPGGHFVVLCGYDREARRALVADPYPRQQGESVRPYEVDLSRILNAILLGVITYDANLLIIRPAM